MPNKNNTLIKKPNNLLIEILACPICKNKLQYDKFKQQLTCKIDKVTFSIHNHIPVMLIKKAHKLT